MNRLIPISPWRICSFVVLVVVVGALPCVIPTTCFKSFVMVHMTGNQAAFARSEVSGVCRGVGGSMDAPGHWN